MGFIKAFTGALQGTFADQWKDFYVPREGVPSTVAIFDAVPQGTNVGIGENTKGSENIISNGSKIIVPEGTALITVQDGAITGFISEPGGYIYNSEDPNSQSIFAGGGVLSATIGQSWERFKFGGQPATQQLAFYINTKIIAGNKFGTRGAIYWDDQFLGTRASGSINGTYSLQIVDPLLFVKNFASEYIRVGAPIFDFADMDNVKGEELFNNFLTSLTGAFTRFSLQSKENGMDTIEYVNSNIDKFSLTMDEEVENSYKWLSNYGIKITSVSLIADYSPETQELLKEVQGDDREIRKAKRMGEAYGNNMPGMMAAASGQAMQAAASNEAGAMMGFMGMNMAGQSGANMMNAVNMQQPTQTVETPQLATQPQQVQPAKSVQPTEDPYAKLAQLKKLLDDGVITQADFDAAKNKLLGI